MTLALLGLHLAVTGVLLPRLLAGSARLQARPALGAALWLALMASFTVALVLAGHHAVEPAAHEPAGLLGLLGPIGLLPHLETTGPVLPHTHDWWLLAAAGAVLAALATSGGTPGGTLAVASTGVLARVRRLARPGSGRRRRPVWWLGLLTLPALPYLLACAPHP
ncbi:hypothetical protein ACIG0C_10270 [Kitasatospora aureofaciens]|uniref:M56 family peptidase n=1 Tax=Kitasatospora aureofaciens TaxID=1894 RepID=A0A1E7MX54_KITAU|nr:hypothetical protein [Kitasatospora aureofaciens]ARF81415.1 hypothetical protein B6264_23110 [Kitasatospora aureofaciens]OEV32999.1 hypothetical protein HS99_0014080 [Kitasatospora aureofaciens]GGU55208.1 hypothetical protein GCM10010502_01690 [Kitasatospora aureofaciens]